MQKTLQSVSQVSFFFFVVFGMVHIISAILVAEKFVNKVDFLAFQSLDLPFLLSALIYGNSKLTLKMGEIFGDTKIPFIILSILSILIFLTVIYLNFFIVDAKLV